MALLNIAKTYARQIMRGNKTFNNVPESMKEQVKEELIKMGAPKEFYTEPSNGTVYTEEDLFGYK